VIGVIVLNALALMLLVFGSDFDAGIDASRGAVQRLQAADCAG
jgi:hypothetical protein